MDKGLKLINELNIELGKLQLKDLENEKVLKEKKEEQEEINSEVKKLNNNLSNLTTYKNCIKSSPKLLKERKKETIKNMIEIVLVCMGATLLVNLINSLSNASFVLVQTIKWLGYTFVGSSIFCTIFGTIMYNDMKKDYNFGNLQEIENEINKINKQLEISKNKQKEKNEEVKTLEDIKNKLQKEIDDCLNKINIIEEARAKVMNDFCKDNVALDNLLNKAYDEKIDNKVKQKIK